MIYTWAFIVLCLVIYLITLFVFVFNTLIDKFNKLFLAALMSFMTFIITAVLCEGSKVKSWPLKNGVVYENIYSEQLENQYLVHIKTKTEHYLYVLDKEPPKGKFMVTEDGYMALDENKKETAR